MDLQTKGRIENLLSGKVKDARRVQRGYTPAERWVVSLEDGRSAFVKIGTTEGSVRALRLEYDVYNSLSGRFIPEMKAWENDDARPILVLEDLSQSYWPPPWTESHVQSVREALGQLHQMNVPMQSFSEVHAGMMHSWKQVEKDPEPFLSLKLVSERWLVSSLPALLELEAVVQTEGNSPTHWDVRSDNICITERGAVLIDWNGACLSQPDLDIGFWLPSLASEGGPQPEEILPNSPEIAAWVCGFFAARAGLPIIENAPRVRMVQLEHLKPALAWVTRAAGLSLPN